MPNPENDFLTQKAVWWSVTGKNRYGEPTVAAAVEICTRWEIGNKESKDNADTTVEIHSVVTVDRDVEVGDILRLGAKIDLPSPVDDLREVRKFRKIPNIKGRESKRIALLIKHGNTLPQLT